MMRPDICRDEHLGAEDLYHQTQASMIREDQRGNQRWVWGRHAVVEKTQWTVDLTDVRQMMSPQRAGGFNDWRAWRSPIASPSGFRPPQSHFNQVFGS